MAMLLRQWKVDAAYSSRQLAHFTRAQLRLHAYYCFDTWRLRAARLAALEGADAALRVAMGVAPSEALMLHGCKAENVEGEEEEGPELSLADSGGEIFSLCLGDEAERFGVATVAATYEDLSADHAKFADLWRFLTRDLDWPCDVDAQISQFDHRAVVHPGPVSDYVSNWAEVRRTLAASAQYAYLLEM